MTSAGSLPPLGGPDYGHGSLPQVLPAVAASIGHPVRGTDGPSLGITPAGKAVVVLLDGLGMQLLRRRAGHAPFLRSLLPSAATVDCGFPSTTATSLASLGTGRVPGQHGILGYQSAHPQTGAIFDHLSWEGGPDPLTWQPGRTIFEELAADGVAVTRIGLPHFDGSGLTTAAQRGGVFVAASSLNASVDIALRALRGPGAALVYLYWGEIDKTGHMHGADSPQWTEELERTDLAMRRLAEQLPAEASLTITADHGMVDVPFEARIDVSAEPDLAAGVRAVTHEPRAPHVYCLPGEAGAVHTRWRERLAGAAVVLTREQAVEEGWFGAVAPANLERIGDVIVATGPGIAIEDRATSKPILLQLKGLHGSLTPDEVAVPLLHCGAQG